MKVTARIVRYITAGVTPVDLKAWRDSGAHLPPSMRDFHAQKDLFKAIHELYKLDEKKDHRDPIGWTDAHIYTVDGFLWFMAAHGYTLQRCRAKQEFYDLDATVEAARKERNAAFAKMLNEAITPGPTDSAPGDGNG